MGNIVLITQIFFTDNKERNKELCQVIANNINSNVFNSIHFLNEDDTKWEFLKKYNRQHVVQKNIGKRLTYADVFKYVVSQNISGYIVFANSDIYFDSTMHNVHMSGLEQIQKIYCQYRWDEDNSGNINLDKTDQYIRGGSQDAWIYHSNSNNIFIENINKFDFQFGRVACDNRFVYEVTQLKFQVVNEPEFIRCIHLHNVNHRTGGKTVAPNWRDPEVQKSMVKGPYAFVKATETKIIYLFWQTPVITELAFYEQKKNDDRYLGIPWAHIIDKKIDLETLYKIIKKQYGNKLYTCCQHIHFHKLINLWRKMGIQTVFTPHKLLNQDEIDGIKLLACPLYAVNIEDSQRNKEIDTTCKKDISYSFIGSYKAFYISKIRENIFNTPRLMTAYIKQTKEWHFEDHEYRNNPQIRENEMLEYNRILTKS